MSFRLQLLFPLGHWALIVFLLLFQLAHRPSCLQASARLRPRCRRSQTVRRPLALASAPRTVARDAGAVDPAVVASVGCEECLRRLRSLQLARRTTTAFAVSAATGDSLTVRPCTRFLLFLLCLPRLA